MKLGNAIIKQFLPQNPLYMERLAVFNKLPLLRNDTTLLSELGNSSSASCAQRSMDHSPTVDGDALDIRRRKIREKLEG